MGGEVQPRTRTRPLRPRLSPPCHRMGRGHQGEAHSQASSSPIFSPTSKLALPNAVSQREMLQVQQPAGWAGHKGGLAGGTRGSMLPCPQNPDHDPLSSSPTFGQLLLG